MIKWIVYSVHSFMLMTVNTFIISWSEKLCQQFNQGYWNVSWPIWTLFDLSVLLCLCLIHTVLGDIRVLKWGLYYIGAYVRNGIIPLSMTKLVSFHMFVHGQYIEDLSLHFQMNWQFNFTPVFIAWKL